MSDSQMPGVVLADRGWMVVRVVWPIDLVRDLDRFSGRVSSTFLLNRRHQNDRNAIELENDNQTILGGEEDRRVREDPVVKYEYGTKGEEGYVLKNQRYQHSPEVRWIAQRSVIALEIETILSAA